jgi:hypothetical protein
MYLLHYGDSSLLKSLTISYTNRSVENSNMGILLQDINLELILKKLLVILK